MVPALGRGFPAVVLAFAAALCPLLSASAQAQPVNGLTLQWKVGGSGAGSQPGEFVFPFGVAVDSRGRFLVTDTEEYDLNDSDGDGDYDEVAVPGNRVQVFSPDGTLETVLGGTGDGPGRFWYPTGVAVDANDQIIVVDSGNNRIQVFSPAGSAGGPLFLAEYGTFGNFDALDPWAEPGDPPLDKLYFPTSVAVRPGTRLLDPDDPDGRLAIVDNGHHRIIVLDAQLQPLMEFGGHGIDEGSFGAFEYPWGVAIDGEGRFFVTDAANHRVQVFDENGQFLWLFGNDKPAPTPAPWDLSAPSAIALDVEGRLLVGDTDRSRVLRVDIRTEAAAAEALPGCTALGASTERQECLVTASDGRSYGAIVVGQYGVGDADLRFPQGIAVDSAGRVAIVDTGNHHLKVFEPSRIHITSLSASAATGSRVASPVELEATVANRTDSFLAVSLDVSASLPGTLSGEMSATLAAGAEHTFVLTFVPHEAGALTFRVAAQGVVETRAPLQPVTRTTSPPIPVLATPVSADLEPPVTTLTTSLEPGPTGWHRQPFTVTLTADDRGGVGLRTITWRAIGMRAFSQTVTANTASFAISDSFQGLTEVTYFATDKNGNQEPPRVARLWLDNTPPWMGRAVLWPRPNAAGWNRSDTVVSFVAGDSGSGVAWTSDPVTVEKEGAGQVFGGMARDQAGNGAQSEVVVNLDKTPPVLTYTLSDAPNANGWHNQPVTVTFTSSDALSGLASVSAPETIAADGIVTVHGTATDVAGNTSVVEVTIMMDRTPPTMECETVSELAWPPNHHLVPWVTSVVLNDLTSRSDGFVLVSVSSFDAGAGNGDGNTTGDLQGFIVGTPDTSGLVRAERSGTGGGRTYSLVYEGRDRAGNLASCTIVTTLVPHDRSGKK
jgi:sugar lactone lactonase YvrE